MATFQPNAALPDITKATHPSAQSANKKPKQIYTSSLVEGVHRGRKSSLIHSNTSARHRAPPNIYITKRIILVLFYESLQERTRNNLTSPSSLASGCSWMDESHPHQYNQILDGQLHSRDFSQSNGQTPATPKKEAISSPN